MRSQEAGGLECLTLLGSEGSGPGRLGLTRPPAHVLIQKQGGCAPGGSVHPVQAAHWLWWLGVSEARRSETSNQLILSTAVT